MAEFDEEKPFPKTDHYLFVGGPKHGQKLEVVTGDPTHKVICPPAPASMLNSGFVDVHTYVRRDLGFEAEDGTRYARTVYCHEEIPNPDVAQHLLMAALLADFVMGGRKVAPNDGVSNVSP